MTMPTRPLIAATALAGAAVLVLAGPASAHVTVDPKQAEKGGYSKIIFKVPNERDNAGTVKVEVNLPTDHPVASVQTTPVPGWKAKVTKSKLDKPLKVHGEQVTEAVTKVTWSGGTIEPGTFEEFPISTGPLPEDTDTLVFKTLQTYEGGEIVRWIEEPREGGEEPESPAPVLTLVKTDEKAHGEASGGEAKPQLQDSEARDGAKDGESDDRAASASDGTARALGAMGIVAGVIGTAVGVLGMRRGSGTSKA